MSKTYYCVSSAFYDDGRVIANIVASKECEEKPSSVFKSKARCDVYLDWFDSHEYAQRCVDECRKESTK